MISKNDYLKNLITDAFKVPIFDVQTTIDTQSLIDYAYELKNKSKVELFQMFLVGNQMI